MLHCRTLCITKSMENGPQVANPSRSFPYTGAAPLHKLVELMLQPSNLGYTSEGLVMPGDKYHTSQALTPVSKWNMRESYREREREGEA